MLHNIILTHNRQIRDTLLSMISHLHDLKLVGTIVIVEGEGTVRRQRQHVPVSDYAVYIYS